MPPANAPGGGPAPGPGIVTTGLEVHMDAGDYPGTGLTWTDPTTSTVFTFASTPSFDADVGYFNFTANNAAGTFVPALNPTRGAVEIWFRWRAASPLTAAVLITGAGANWVSLGNATGSLPDESLELNTGISAVMDDKQGHTFYRDGEWHQMVAVIDGAANTFYVDGLPVTSTFRAGAVNSTGLINLAATILGKYTAGYQFDGDISIIRVYDTGANSFSAADAAQNYAAQSARFDPGYRPDDATGLTLWIDPSDATTITYDASNSYIENIADKAFVIADTQCDSVGVNGIVALSSGGIDFLLFNGVDQYMQTKSGGVVVPLSSVLGTSATGWEMHAVISSDTATGVSVTHPYDNNNAIMDSGGYWGIATAVDPGDPANVRVQPKRIRRRQQLD